MFTCSAGRFPRSASAARRSRMRSCSRFNENCVRPNITKLASTTRPHPSSRRAALISLYPDTFEKSDAVARPFHVAWFTTANPYPPSTTAAFRSAPRRWTVHPIAMPRVADEMQWTSAVNSVRRKTTTSRSSIDEVIARSGPQSARVSKHDLQVFIVA